MSVTRRFKKRGGGVKEAEDRNPPFGGTRKRLKHKRRKSLRKKSRRRRGGDYNHPHKLQGGGRRRKKISRRSKRSRRGRGGDYNHAKMWKAIADSSGGRRRNKKSRRSKRSRRGGNDKIHLGGRRRKKRSRRRQRGGYGAGAGPLGYSYIGGDQSTWPGVRAAQGINSNGITMANYYPLSKTGIGVGGVDPYPGTSNQNGGGGRSTIIPQDVVNFGRDIIAGPTKLLMGWQGQKMPVSHEPSVTNQPIDQNIKYLSQEPPNILAIHTAAGESVANI